MSLLSKIFGSSTKRVVDIVQAYKLVSDIFGKKVKHREVIDTLIDEDVKERNSNKSLKTYTMNDAMDYYTLSEASKALGKSTKEVHDMLVSGKLSAEKVDGEWRIFL